ncbi:MAG: ABC transporter permease [Planctomycetota bacterium]
MSYEHLHWLDLLIALGLMVVSIGLARLERVGYTKQLVVGTVRTVLQLLAIGFVLRGVFDVKAWWLNLIVLLVMVTVATWNAVRRQDHPLPGYPAIVAVALLVGPFFVLGVVILAVIRVDPWFKAQYLIPLGGMIIAYAMNAVTLYKNRFDGELRARRREVEARLALGATARIAGEDVVRQSYRAALLPTINFMMVVGIVQIPGMMGGQLIGGVKPLDAALYQILVAFQLAAAAVVSCFVVSRLTFRRVFSKDHQLVLPQGGWPCRPAPS